MFGVSMSGANLAQAVFGGLVGVAATKFIPSAIPNIGLGSSGISRILISLGSAFAAGYAAEKAIGKTFGSAVLFGGLMQTGSVALNAFLPSIGSQIGLTGRRRGVGDLINTRGHVVPSNPVRMPIAPRVTTSGLNRAWGPAF